MFNFICFITALILFYFQEPVEKKSRYINTMLKNRDNREKEQELRAERKIQKEREAEGDEFQDKEAFVTSAYKEKLEQMRKAQQDIDRQENMDNILDVTKQSDLNGFYRSLYRNDLFNNEQVANLTEKSESEPVKFNKKSTTQKNLRDRNLKGAEDHEEDDENEETVIVRKPEIEKQSEKLVETPSPVEQPSTNNLKRSFEEEKPKSDDQPAAEIEKETKTVVTINETLQEEVEVIKKPKIDRIELIRQMFTKRTVGQAFEDARQRYFERKAQRAQVA